MFDSVNLHYENLPELDSTEPQRLMGQAYYQLSDYRRYLQRALEWMWTPERLEKVRWEVGRAHNGLRPSSTAGPPGLPGSIWLTLKEVDQGGETDVVESFCDADFVVERPGPHAPRIRILEADHNTGSILLEREPEALKEKADDEGRVLYLPPNEYALKQQTRSLQHLLDNPDPEHRGLLRLVENGYWVEWPRVEPISLAPWEFLKDSSVAGTDEQRRFVQIALGTPDFAILEGPPGSGKTTTICELIIQEIRRGHRVLLCASTHVAVDNVLESLQEHGSTDNEIIAVRIGDKWRLSDEVRQFQLQERAHAERSQLIEKLSKVSRRSGSQEYLLKALQESDDSMISRLILESANLVCGTTLGILQHPDIKEQIRERRAKKSAIKYDCLILDEASKTTFQEFLVPAMFASRWILVGDVRQLSPFVETRDLEANIRAIVSEEDALVCTRTFQCRKDLKTPTRGLVVVDDENHLQYSQQARSLGLNVLDLWNSDGQPASLDFLSSDVIVAKRSISGVEDMIPPDADLILKDSAPSSRLLRRRDYWKEHFSPSRVSGEDPNRELEWAKEIAWRLNRTFELRNDPKGAERYLREIGLLLPHWYDLEALDYVESSLDIVKRVSLPSMLQLLQLGFQRREEDRTGSSLTDGIRPEAFEARNVKLSYQHRMHPDISNFPREEIYESGSLMDPEDLVGKREWSYRRYSSRAGWMNVQGIRGDASYSNRDEVETIATELQAFLLWAGKNPKESGGARKHPWQAAVLTFYRRQEWELRRRLQVLFRQPFARANFSARDGSVTVRLCTVDRFQGHEADIVFLSFVRVHGLGFLDSPFRLNVALTRARYQLVLVGNQRMFASQTRSDLLGKLADGLPRFGIALGSGTTASRLGGEQR